MPTATIHARPLLPRPACLALLLLCFLPWQALGCVVPVFRYALENWPADTMELAVFHPGALSAEDRQLIDHVKSQTLYNGGILNLEVWEFEPGTDLPDWANHVWKLHSEKASSKPWWILVDNSGAEGPKILGSGKLERETLAGMLDSPARRQAARAILSGKAWAWLVVSSDPRKRADLDFQFATALTKVSEQVELPSREEMEADPLRPNRPMAQIPLVLETETVHIDPADPAERGLLGQLSLPSEEGPVVYAMFGEGRVIGPIYGQDLVPESFEQLSLFLAGPCSCQIKDLNPGFDIVVAADWQSVFGETRDPDAVGLEKDPILFPPTTTNAAASSAAKDTPEQEKPPSRWIIATVWAIGSAIGSVLVLLLVAAIRRRKSQRK